MTITLPTTVAGRPCEVMILSGSIIATLTVGTRANIYGASALFPITGIAPGTYKVRAFCQKVGVTALPLATYAPSAGDFANLVATNITITAGQETTATVTLAASTTSTDFQ